MGVSVCAKGTMRCKSDRKEEKPCRLNYRKYSNRRWETERFPKGKRPQKRIRSFPWMISFNDVHQVEVPARLVRESAVGNNSTLSSFSFVSGENMR